MARTAASARRRRLPHQPASAGGERVPANIHYIKEHYRGNRAHSSPPPKAYRAANRRGTLFEACMLTLVLVLVVVGVWLITRVASVGRTHDDCLESARRVCGLVTHGRSQ